MNQASAKISTADGTAQTKTCWTACAIAKNTSCRTAAGSELTLAGSSWPPLALICVPGPAAAESEVVSCRAKIAPNAATPSDPPILEAVPYAGG